MVYLYEHLTPEHEKIVLIDILDFIKRFRLSRSKEIAFEALKLNNWQSAVKSTEVLLTMGVTQKEIVELLYPQFKSGNPAISEAAFAVFAEHISGPYLPGATEILDTFVLERSTHEKIYNASDVPSIFIKSGVHFLEDRLYDLLGHDSDNVRFGILAIMIGYFYKGSYYFFNFLTPKLINRYWELTRDANTSIAAKSITLLGMVGLISNKVDYVDDLLSISRGAKNDQIKYASLEAINTMMHRIPYPVKIEAFYLECLTQDDERLSRIVIDGLRFSPNRSFKEKLWHQYKDHSNSSIKNAAQKLLKPNYRRWRIFKHHTLLMMRKVFGNRGQF